MIGQIGISSNVQISLLQRVASSPSAWRLVDYQQVHNIITTEGLNAWAYNLINSDGQVIDRIAYGSDGTTPALGDTALGSALYTSTADQVAVYVVEDAVIVEHWITAGSPGRSSLDAQSIAEMGLYTANSGATASSNKFVARVALPQAYTLTSDLDLWVTWTLRVTPTDSDTTWYPLGRNFIATRMADLTTYGVLGYVAFGDGAEITPDSTTVALTNEITRAAATFTRTGSQIDDSGTLTTGEWCSGNITEAGAAIGSTADLGVIHQNRPTSTSCLVDVDWTFSMVLSNCALPAVTGNAYAAEVWHSKDAVTNPSSPSSDTYFFSLGTGLVTTIEDCEIPWPVAGTIDVLYVAGSSKLSSSRSCSVEVYRNGAATGLIANFGSNINYVGSDTGSVAVSIGDRIGIKCWTVGAWGGLSTFVSVGIGFQPE